MSTIDPASPSTANLRQSIEDLIAEAVRHSRETEESERVRLRSLLQDALTAVDQARTSLETVHAQLSSSLASIDQQPVAWPPAPMPSDPAPTPTPADPTPNGHAGEGEPATFSAPASAPVSDDRPSASEPTVEGPHTVDVIAHNVDTLALARDLQSFFRGQHAVAGVTTREFVNRELRLSVACDSPIPADALESWVAAHGGRIATRTGTTLEVHFANAAS